MAPDQPASGSHVGMYANVCGEPSIRSLVRSLDGGVG